ncbi:hypothetical protein TNCV_1111821 [Trichonephila clavipes]|nr:hypothetical protein TNCV_1111821 [Trichonephila clavipes]
MKTLLGIPDILIKNIKSERDVQNLGEAMSPWYIKGDTVVESLRTAALDHGNFKRCAKMSWVYPVDKDFKFRSANVHERAIESGNIKTQFI